MRLALSASAALLAAAALAAAAPPAASLAPAPPAATSSASLTTTLPSSTLTTSRRKWTRFRCARFCSCSNYCLWSLCRCFVCDDFVSHNIFDCFKDCRD